MLEQRMQWSTLTWMTVRSRRSLSCPKSNLTDVYLACSMPPTPQIPASSAEEEALILVATVPHLKV